MKKSALVFAALAFVALLAPSPVLAQQAPTFTQRDNTGLVPYQAKRFAGKKIDFSLGPAGSALNSTTSTTFDIFAFGFTSDYVQICIAGSSGPVFFRRGTSTSNLVGNLDTSATRDRLIVPISTPTLFISGNTTWERAMPISTRVTSNSVIGTTTQGSMDECVGFPIATPGLVFHVQSGLATLDVRAFSSK